MTPKRRTKSPEPTPGALYLLLPAFCNNEYLDARPQYAVIEVDVPFVERMLADMERVRQFARDVDKAIYTFELWDFSPTWIASLGDWQEKIKAVDLLSGGSEFMEAVDQGGVALLTEKPAFDEDDDANRTECGTRVVSHDGVKWQAMPDGTSAYLDTAEVGPDTWQKIQAVLQRQRSNTP